MHRQSQLTRRRLIQLGAALTASGLIGGCGRSSDSLRATWWGDPNLNDAVVAAIDGFTERESIAVSSEFMPWEGYWDKLATQTAGKSEPDLIMQAGTYLPEYVPRDVLLDLRPSQERGALTLDALDAGVRDIGAREGGLYAVTAAINSLGMLFNVTMLRDAGIEVPDHTWTWDDLVELSAQVREYGGDEVYGVQDGGSDLIALQIWARQRGTEMFTDDALTITAAEVTEWLSMWEELRARGLAPPGAVTSEGADLATSPIVQGRAAFMIGWNQDMAAVAELMSDEIGITMLPTESGGEPGQWLNAASMWAASAGSERPDDVVALIQYLLNDDAAVSALGTWLGVPPLQRARDQLRDGLDQTSTASLDYIELVERNSRPLPQLWPAGFTEMRDLLPRLNEDVAFGRRSVDDAADRFFAEAERILT